MDKEDSVLSSNEYSAEKFDHLLGLMLLENSYNYRGHYLFHSDLFNPNFVKDLDGYIKFVYKTLGECVINTNETLDIDEFIEFKKSTVLKIVKINKPYKSSVSSLSNELIKNKHPYNNKFYSTLAVTRSPGNSFGYLATGTTQARGLPVCIRSIHLPANPTISYKSIQALVIKDRNPIGKFKQTPSAKGIVTIFITPEGLHHNDSILAHYYDEYRRNFEMKHAFSSHLDNNCNYSILVSIRKAKHNINLRFMTDDIINKDFIINNLDKIIT
jgi:hypothetical protein